jgi:hypothetical protein
MGKTYAGAQMVGDGYLIGPVMPHTCGDTVEKARELTTKLYEKLQDDYGMEIDFMLVEREDEKSEWKACNG